MRRHLFAIGLLALVLHTFARGDDKADEARAIVNKAIKALGGADQIEKFQASKVKTKALNSRAASLHPGPHGPTPRPVPESVK